MAEKPCAQIST